jgi:large subunit ribosomal protein L22
MRGYTHQPRKGETVARARGVELHISPKKTYEVLNAIRGLPLSQARRLLEDVAALRRAVPFRRYNQETAHKRGTGPGRYPRKVARELLKVLHNVEANAEFEGMNTDDLVLVTASCSRGRILKAFMPRAHGRGTDWNEQTTNVEIVVAESREK